MEVLVVDERIREKIISRSPSNEIKEVAVEKQGMKTLRGDGFQKCFEGITTLEEVINITSEE